MIGIQSYAAKAAAAVERARAGLARAELRLAEHDASRPEGDDADALFVWRRERRDLEDRVESDREAVAWAEARAAEAVAAEANKAADAAHAAMAKRQTASAKRIRALGDKFIAPLVAELEWLEAETEAFDAYNTTRGQHSYIDDPEKAVRQTRGRTIEAIYEEREVWEDGHGHTPTVFRGVGDEMAPVEAGYSKRRVRVCVQPERVIPPAMPDRLADLLPALRKALTE